MKVTKGEVAKLSKNELIELLFQVLFLVDPFERNGYLERAMIDIRYNQQIKRIDEQAQHSKKAFEARCEYLELLKPYEGKPFSSIPLDVLTKADDCIKRANQHDKAYERLSKEIDKCTS